MRVITNNPITYSSACGVCSSSFDGNFDSGNSSHVKEFQNYANSKGASLKVDGIWGAKTGAEWNKYKKEFLAANKSSTSSTPSTTTANEPTEAQKEKQKKKGLGWDKTKKAWVSLKDSGVIDKIGGFVGGILGGKDDSTTTTDTTAPDGTPKKGLSTGAWVGIGLGTAVLGTILYFALRKKN